MLSNAIPGATAQDRGNHGPAGGQARLKWCCGTLASDSRPTVTTLATLLPTGARYRHRRNRRYLAPRGRRVS